MKLSNLSVKPEDFTSEGKFDAGKTADVFTRIGKAFAEAMDHGLSADNLRVQDVTVTIQTGAAVATSFPLAAIKLESFMPPQPKAVRVMARSNLTTPTAAFTTASDVDWVPAGDRQVSVRYITGLAVSTKYLITLRIEG